MMTKERVEELLRAGCPSEFIDEYISLRNNFHAAYEREERLRKALKPFARVPPWGDADQKLMVTQVSSGPYHLIQAHFDEARAALKAEEKG